MNFVVQVYFFNSNKKEKEIASYNKNKLSNKQQDEKKAKERQSRIQAQIGVIGKLYNFVIYICAFASCTREFVTSTKRRILFDNRTRWNSWFLMLCVALEDKVKAGLQLYVERYEDDLKDDILSISKWIHLCTIRDFL